MAAVVQQIKGFTANAETALLARPWKGNVRELANAIEYAINMESTAYISLGSLPARLRAGLGAVCAPQGASLRAAEAELIRQTLAECGDTLPGKACCAKLGISLSTLYRKI